MALSRFAYVRSYEQQDAALPNTYMLVRLDGKGFHKFSAKHQFHKPNDARALELMNHAARKVMEQLRPEVVLAFGESDEYSRRQSKILTYITSLFTSNYVLAWSTFFPHQHLDEAPSFDGRLVLYPTEKEVRDYFSWRQADTHVNNLYNTVFWAMVQGGRTEREAHERLKGTLSADKNEILFNEHNINYDSLPPLFRKGSILCWGPEADAGLEQKDSSSPSSLQVKTKAKSKMMLRTLHVDIIGHAFWSSSRIQPRSSVPLVETNEDAEISEEGGAADQPDSNRALNVMSGPAEQPDRTDSHRTNAYAGLGARALAS
ncbi:trnahis guanylyltransferase [Ceraceosorus bombacis]|uniref:tRNA(His) guanylyltransferase n=1 Tax=Ceraceosorus bombacis TaxID=401625 RepID=A0A0P1BPQ7_9BASI|nr:trnahis guanylyltransferase [Ceraceosorus bombacis]